MKPRSPWAWVGLLCATATASYLCRVNVSVAGALLMDELHLSQAQMGRVFSAFLLGYALFMVPGGALADRWGTRRVLELASWWWVGATLLQVLVGRGPFAAGAASTLAALMALRFVLGIGQAPTFPAAAGGVARWIGPESRGRANGFVIAAIALGSAIAPPLLSWVMVRWGWRTALAVSTLPALATAVAWLAAPASRPPRPAPPAASPTDPSSAGCRRPRPDAASLRSPSFVLLTLSYTLQGYVGYIFVFWFYLYLVQERHFDLLQGARAQQPALAPLDRFDPARRVAVGPPRRPARRRARPAAAVPLVGLAVGRRLPVAGRADHECLPRRGVPRALDRVRAVRRRPLLGHDDGDRGRRSGMAGGVMNMGSNVGGSSRRR